MQQLLRRGGGATATATATSLDLQGWRRRLAAASSPTTPKTPPSSNGGTASAQQHQHRPTVAAEAGGKGGSSSRSGSLRARESKLGWVASDHRKEVAQCVEMAERSAERWTVNASLFVTPLAAADAIEAVRQACGDSVAAIPWGGYAQAERCRVAVGPRELLMPMTTMPEAAESGTLRKDEDQGDERDAQGGGAAATTTPDGRLLPPATLAALDEARVIAAASVRGQFMFDPATHRDFLGAVLGTGISRDRVGDVVAITERGAVVLVDPLLLEHLERELTSVRSVKVSVSEIPLSELRLPPPRCESLKSVEASMRLDAVASAGFRMPRSKMADAIRSGDVKLSYRVVIKASAEVKQGDVVSVAGKGRLEVVSVSETGKGKFAVEMVRRS